MWYHKNFTIQLDKSLFIILSQSLQREAVASGLALPIPNLIVALFLFLKNPTSDLTSMTPLSIAYSHFGVMS